LWLIALQVFALSSFAISQPLYDLLGGTPDFFVANGASVNSLLAAVLFMALGIPAALVGILALARMFGFRLGHCCYLIVVAALIALILLPPLNRSGMLTGWGAVAVAVALGSAVAMIFHARPRVRLFAAVLSPAGILFAAVFLFWTDVAKIIFPIEVEIEASAHRAVDIPVVFVIFDMFSLPAMLDSAGGIDRLLFPNFSNLATQSYWFKNASTVATSTTRSVPAILTGGYPQADALPLASEYPHNLFTLMGQEAGLHVFESATELCPQNLCPREARSNRTVLWQLMKDMWVIYQHVVLPVDLKRSLASIDSNWGGFGVDSEEGASADQAKKVPLGERIDKQARAETKDRLKSSLHRDRTEIFEAFLRTLQTPTKNGLFYLHLNLPHSPIALLPSGKTYIPKGKAYAPMRALEGNRSGNGVGRWTQNRQLVGLGYQRYLLQASYADKLLGRLVETMEETGLFDRALVVIVSDHGKSFVPGKGQRPSDDCASHCVPLFIKLPGQREGIVREGNVETIDILPTIADVLTLSATRDFDGRSLFSSESGGRREKHILGGGEVTRLLWPGDYLAQSVYQLSNLKALVMSANAQATLGPSPAFVGRKVQDVVATGGALELFDSTSPTGGLGFEIDQRALLDNVSLDMKFVPAYITGRILPAPVNDARLSLALAVDGVVQATTYTFTKDGRPGQFALLVPESVIAHGRNGISVLLLQDR
jgi:hypothetical protein